MECDYCFGSLGVLRLSFGNFMAMPVLSHVQHLKGTKELLHLADNYYFVIHAVFSEYTCLSGDFVNNCAFPSSGPEVLRSANLDIPAMTRHTMTAGIPTTPLTSIHEVTLESHSAYYNPSMTTNDITVPISPRKFQQKPGSTS